MLGLHGVDEVQWPVRSANLSFTRAASFQFGDTRTNKYDVQRCLDGVVVPRHRCPSSHFQYGLLTIRVPARGDLNHRGLCFRMRWFNWLGLLMLIVGAAISEAVFFAASVEFDSLWYISIAYVVVAAALFIWGSWKT